MNLTVLNEYNNNLIEWLFYSYSIIFSCKGVRQPVISRSFSVQSKVYNKNAIDSASAEKWKLILGRKGTMLNAHKISTDHIKSGKPVNYEVINDILAYSNISISQEIFNDLINIKDRVLIENLDTKEARKFIKDNFGSLHSKTQIPGVYIFTHKFTGDKYVGSTSQLSIRLTRYLGYRHELSGKFIPILHKDKTSSFTLEIIPLVNNYPFRPEIILEQYYLLDPSFNLNTIKVANNPSGSNAKPLFMYNRDKTILYYSSTQQKDFIVNLNISHFTFTKHLNKGSYYLGKYHFSRKLESNAKVKEISIFDLALQLEKDRKIFNKNKPITSLSRSILMCLNSNSIDSNTISGDNTVLFHSIGKCVEYLRSKGHPATPITLLKYIDTGKSYYGYTFKSV